MRVNKHRCLPAAVPSHSLLRSHQQLRQTRHAIITPLTNFRADQSSASRLPLCSPGVSLTNPSGDRGFHALSSCDSDQAALAFRRRISAVLKPACGNAMGKSFCKQKHHLPRENVVRDKCQISGKDLHISSSLTCRLSLLKGQYWFPRFHRKSCITSVGRYFNR